MDARCVITCRSDPFNAIYKLIDENGELQKRLREQADEITALRSRVDTLTRRIQELERLLGSDPNEKMHGTARVDGFHD